MFSPAQLCLVICGSYLVFDVIFLPLCACSFLAIILHRGILEIYPEEKEKWLPSSTWIEEISVLLIGPILEEHVFRWWLPTLLFTFDVDVSSCHFWTIVLFSTSHFYTFWHGSNRVSL